MLWTQITLGHKVKRVDIAENNSWLIRMYIQRGKLLKRIADAYDRVLMLEANVRPPSCACREESTDQAVVGGRWHPGKSLQASKEAARQTVEEASACAFRFAGRHMHAV